MGSKGKSHRGSSLDVTQIVDDLIHATHKGKGVCVRYAQLKPTSREIIEEQYKLITQEILKLDLSREFESLQLID